MDSQPKVDPNHWAGRRKKAMNRARELRSKIKDNDNTEASSVSSWQSKSELQRQRRTKRLEAAQKLLDNGGFDFTSPSPSTNVGGSLAERHEARLAKEQQLKQYNHDEQPVGGRGSNNEIAIHQQTALPIEVEGSKGRGRGRGRLGSGSGSSGTVGNLSRSSRSNNVQAAVTDQFQDAKVVDSSSKLRSKSSHQLQAYLESRQVQEYKEGECEKTAILRQRLVARRRKRHGGVPAAESKTRIPSKSSTSYNQPALVEDSSRTMLERLDPNDYTAKDFSATQAKSPGKDRPPSSYNYPPATASDENDDEASVVNIELIQCDCCKRSFAPKIYEKHFDANGEPKCLSAMEKKRTVFNSAKARIQNNSNLNSDEQIAVLQANKNAIRELRRRKSSKKRGSKPKRNSKWREESNQFREAMRANRGL